MDRILWWKNLLTKFTQKERDKHDSTLKEAPFFIISFYTNDENSFSNFVFIYVLFCSEI